MIVIHIHIRHPSTLMPNDLCTITVAGKPAPGWVAPVTSCWIILLIYVLHVASHICIYRCIFCGVSMFGAYSTQLLSANVEVPGPNHYNIGSMCRVQNSLPLACDERNRNRNTFSNSILAIAASLRSGWLQRMGLALILGSTHQTHLSMKRQWTGEQEGRWLSFSLLALQLPFHQLKNILLL